ncbi:MAG: hypothetical protein ACF8XB_22640 [Planctomycetota bacterium JB042]
MFEAGHTISDRYDGPTGGLADFRGSPHLYETQWSAERRQFGPRFTLSPVDEVTLVLALEDWAIWLRWERAFKAGAVGQATHPALPEDRERHEELRRLLQPRLVLDARRAFEVNGEFRWQACDGGEPLLQVRWYDPADSP